MKKQCELLLINVQGFFRTILHPSMEVFKRSGCAVLSLSTREMVSLLEVDKIAICLDNQEYSYGVKIIDVGFYWIDGGGNISDIFSLRKDVID